MPPTLKPLSYFDVIDACAQPGCPFCRLADETVNRYLDAILYENVTDPGARDDLRAALGYCNVHAWRLPEIGGAALGIAVIYQDLLTEVTKRLAEAKFQAPAGLWQRASAALAPERPATTTAATVAAVSPRTECPACLQRERVEALALGATVEALARRDPVLQQALQHSAGVCLVHLRRALELTQEPAGFEFWQQLVQAKFGSLLSELSEFIRKNDYRFTGEGFGAEGDSWRRAIAALVGAPGVR